MSVLCSIDERTPDNLMEGPWVLIEERAAGFATRTAFFNKTGFATYAHLVDEYRCDGLEIAIEDIAEDRLQAWFTPDFSPIRHRDAITQLGVTGAGAFAADLDLDVFRTFGRVQGLSTQGVSFGGRLPELFPHLQAWRNLDWKSNPVTASAGAWPALAHLSLQGFNGSLAVFEGAPLETLFLIASTVGDVSEVLRFPRLSRLQMVSCRLAGDISTLSALAQLRSLRVEGKNKLTGWESFGSATLVNVEASHVPCRFPTQQFPRLENYAVNAYRGGDPFNDSGGDIDLLADEFDSLVAPD